MVASESIDTKTDNDAEHELEGPRKRSVWQAVNLGYLAAGIATLVKSFLAIDRNFFHIIRENKRLDPLLVDRETRFPKVYPREDALSAKHLSWLNEAESIERNRPGTLQKVYNKIEKELLARDGVHNSWDKFIRLKPHHRMDIISNVMIVGSVALGAIISYNREASLANKLHRQVAKQVVAKQEALVNIASSRSTESAPSAVARLENKSAVKEEAGLSRTA